MKMKTIIKLLFVFSLPFIFCRCADDGIHYERDFFFHFIRFGDRKVTLKMTFVFRANCICFRI